MNLFVIGDVHGCWHTWQALLRHWRAGQELLVQTGDLVDRGHFGPECVQLALELDAAYPNHTAFLKGNHEYELLNHYGPAGPNPHWLRWGGAATVRQYEARAAWLPAHLEWLARRPLFWENENLLVSHAGFANTPNPLDEDNNDGVLWRRGPLRNVGRRQVIGHTPTTGQPEFYADSNTYNLDTGAYLGRGLTALRFADTGELLNHFREPTHRIDIAP